MKTIQKISDTSVRVLETLKILFNNSASIQDIIHYFEKFDQNNRIYTNEAVLKYINTFKVFGFKFVKNKDKYVILNSFNQFNFDESDLKSIYLIEKFNEAFPEEKIKSEINKFLQDLEKHFSNNSKILAHNLTKPDFVNFSYNYSKYSELIREYENYCSDRQKLKITYRNQNKNEVSIMVEPNEIKYIRNEIYLSVYNPVSAQIQDINFNSIIKIDQLPLKSNPVGMFSSVTFCIKDRLAKSYKLHESEKLLQVNPDGSSIILNQKEDRILLLKRLMRYGEYCEIISPKDFREEMKQTIRKTLQNY